MATKQSVEIVQEAFGSWLYKETLEEIRAGYDAMAPAVGDDISVEEGKVGGVPGLWARPSDVGQGTILYFHGGGYQIGSPRSHVEMVSHIVRSSGASAFLPEYRLSPEQAFPAAIDDAFAVYQALLESGVAASQMAVAGDSAGGGLAIATTYRAKAEGLALPSSVSTMSAWADLSCAGISFEENKHRDPEVTPEMALGMAADYLDGHDPMDPLASPVFADLTGFPAMLLQVGTEEILGDDTYRVAESASRAGVDVTLEVAYGQVHVYQLLTWLVPEARASLERTGQFIDRHFGND